jgi:hypothetical protein
MGVGSGLDLAPLAQLVERFHGKEKVTGPIPVGGSKEFFTK